MNVPVVSIFRGQQALRFDQFANVSEFPLIRAFELREAEAGVGFAFLGEKMLH